MTLLFSAWVRKLFFIVGAVACSRLPTPPVAHVSDAPLRLLPPPPQDMFACDQHQTGTSWGDVCGGAHPLQRAVKPDGKSLFDKTLVVLDKEGTPLIRLWVRSCSPPKAAEG